MPYQLNFSTLQLHDIRYSCRFLQTKYKSRKLRRQTALLAGCHKQPPPRSDTFVCLSSGDREKPLYPLLGRRFTCPTRLHASTTSARPLRPLRHAPLRLGIWGAATEKRLSAVRYRGRPGQEPPSTGFLGHGRQDDASWAFQNIDWCRARRPF